MKKKFLVFLALYIFVTPNLWAQDNFNPFKSIGKDARVLTLSDGKYSEFFDTDSIAIVGSAVLNINTMKIIGFIVSDTIYSEATLEPEIVSRWLSIDPMARKYPSESPYNFGLNNPLYYIDPDGGEVEPSDASKTVTPNLALGLLVHKAAKTYFDTKPGWRGEITYSSLLTTGRADLVYKQQNHGSIWEIKPESYRTNPSKNAKAKAQVGKYLMLASASQPEQFSIGSSNGTPKPFEGELRLPITDGAYNYDAVFYIPQGEEGNGLIYYRLENQRPSKVTEQVKEFAKNTAIVFTIGGIGAISIATAPQTAGASLVVGAGVIGTVLAPPSEDKPIEQ